jgi:5-methylcytosine-specific restriction endonuclease McrA
MKKSFRDYYSWTLSDFSDYLKKLGYGSDSSCLRAAKNWLRQSGSLFARDFRKKYYNSETSCLICKSKEKIEIDHIVPLFAGGKNEEVNMQFLCRTCHKKKSATDYWLYKVVSK